MSVVDQLRHKAVKERQEQRVDVASVNIGIRHQDDLVIFQFRDIEVISVTLRESTSKGIDHGLDLSIRENLVHRRFFNV